MMKSISPEYILRLKSASRIQREWQCKSQDYSYPRTRKKKSCNVPSVSFHSNCCRLVLPFACFKSHWIGSNIYSVALIFIKPSLLQNFICYYFQIRHGCTIFLLNSSVCTLSLCPFCSSRLCQPPLSQVYFTYRALYLPTLGLYDEYYLLSHPRLTVFCSPERDNQCLEISLTRFLKALRLW